MDTFSGISWLWRALRGRSVTFAALFALGVLGVSVLSEFRHLLSKLGAPWYAWFILPIIVVAILARKEAEWLPKVEARKKWSRWLVIGSLVAAFAISKLRDDPPPKAAPPATQSKEGRAQIPRK